VSTTQNVDLAFADLRDLDGTELTADAAVRTTRVTHAVGAVAEAAVVAAIGPTAVVAAVGPTAVIAAIGPTAVRRVGAHSTIGTFASVDSRSVSPRSRRLSDGFIADRSLAPWRTCAFHSSVGRLRIDRLATFGERRILLTACGQRQRHT
jgi:hypothetical protein